MAALVDLQNQLVQAGLDKIVSAQTVYEWFELGQQQNRPLLALTLLLGLASSRMPSQIQADKLLRSAQKLQAEWADGNDQIDSTSELTVLEVEPVVGPVSFT